MSNRFLRDLLYFDFDKAASLWSQLAGGLREKVALTTEGQSDKKRSLTLGIPKVFEAQFGGAAAEKQSVLESKSLHHDLLNLLEESLTDLGLAVDLNGTVPSTEASPEAFRAAIGCTPYVIAQGYSAIEDSQRIHKFAGTFNPITRFVATCGAQGDPVTERLLKEREEKLRLAEGESDKHKKQRHQHDANRLTEQIQAELQKRLPALDQWLLDGIQLFIDTYMRDRITFRVYPFPNCPSWHLLCNLKRDCFVDQDLEHLLYGYGNRPTVPLAVFGLVTALPPMDGNPFNPMKEFDDPSLTGDTVVFEKAFRNLFDALEGIEVFARYSRYPNISVHPIAVFRQFELPSSKK